MARKSASLASLLFIISIALFSPVVSSAAMCVVGVCGDGILNPGEGCDDGNLVNGDGCSSTCQPSFNMSVGSAVATYTDGYPRSMAVADLNNDGIKDFLVTTFRNAWLYPYLINHDGSITPKGRYALGSNTGMIDTGELNGDHNVDVVTIDIDTDQMHVFFGNGDGTLTLANIFIPGDRPRSVKIADLNNDGLDDIIAGCMYTGFRIYYGDGAGHFPTNQVLTTTGPSMLSDVADLNGDGYQDLVLTAYTIDIYHGGPFGLTKVQSLPYNTANARFVDLNHDGFLDLLTSGVDIRTFLNDGNGAFFLYGDLNDGVGGYIMDMRDLNNDGKIDWTVSTRVQTYARVFLGDGKGWYSQQINYPLPDDNDGVVITDLNLDGTPDMLVSLYYGVMKVMPVYNWNRYQFPRCGDGRIGQGETCDDGNRNDGDGCSAICRLEVSGDSDHDGLDDNEETVIYHTDPLNPDSDGDCVHDGDEVCSGSDPLDPSDQTGCQQIVTPAGDNWRVAVTLTEASAGLDSDVYLAQPEVERLIRHSLTHVGRVAEVTVNGGDVLTFFIRVFADSWGLGTYDHYSNTYFARVERIDAYSYWVRFEDLPVTMADWDYNDVVLRVEFLPETPAEGVQTNSLEEYQATQIVGMASGGTVTLAFDGFAELEVPMGAVIDDAGVVLTAGLDENYMELDGKGANLVPDSFKKLMIANGQPVLAADANLVIAYDDADGDGVGVGTGMAESNLKLLRFDETAGIWVEEPTVVDTQFNTVAAPVSENALYAVGSMKSPPQPPPSSLPVNLSVPGCTVGTAGGSRASSVLALFLPLAIGLAFRMGWKKRA